jgi:hypothetical protein
VKRLRNILPPAVVKTKLKGELHASCKTRD